MSKLMDNLHIIYSDCDLQRLTYVEGRPTVWLDTHGMTCHEAERYINNVINLADCPLRLAIIHGYNRGTAISDMVRKSLKNKRIKQRILSHRNRGVTYLDIS